MKKIIPMLFIMAACSPKAQHQSDQPPYPYGHHIYGTIGIYNSTDNKVYKSDSGYVLILPGLQFNKDCCSYGVDWHTKDGRSFGSLETVYFEPYEKKDQKQFRFRPKDSESNLHVQNIEWTDTAFNHEFRMAIYKYLGFPLREEDYSIPYPHPKRKGDTSYAMIWKDTLVITHDEHVNIFGWEKAVGKCLNPVSTIWFKGDSSIVYTISKEPYGRNWQSLWIKKGDEVKFYAFEPHEEKCY